MTALQAAEKLMADRGYVVVGMKAGEREAVIGELLNDFAGKAMAGKKLQITKPSSRLGWDRQVAHLGLVDKNVHVPGERFYRAVLVAEVANGQ